MESNKERHDDLEKKGEIYSEIKDGKPKTSLEKIIAKGYPILIGVIAIITGLLIASRKKVMRWDVYFPYLLFSCICGWSWNIYMENIDPKYPGWILHPWAILGPEWLNTLEDWLFYPVCGSFFYVIFRIINNSNKSPEWAKWLIQAIHLIMTLFFIYYGAVAGRSIAIQSAAVGIVLFFYTWERWDVKHYLKMFTFIVLFAGLWDWAAVSWITRIPGWSWAAQWFYISFDASGQAHHSSLFLSYDQHRWAWIFNNPIEITPWFGIASAMFTYSVTMAIEKFIDTNKNRLVSTK